MHVGFIGLGNVGGKLAGSVLRNGLQLTVFDIDKSSAAPFLEGGASFGHLFTIASGQRYCARR